MLYKPPYTVEIKVFDKDYNEVWNNSHEGDTFNATDLTAELRDGYRFEIYNKPKGEKNVK